MNLKRSVWITTTLILITVATAFYNIYVDALTNERIYLRGIFPYIRRIYDSTLGHLPFPFIYIVFPILILLLGFGIYDLVRSYSSKTRLAFLRRLLNALCIVYILFYWSWAVNYKNRPIQDQLNLIDVKLDSMVIYEEANFIMSKLVLLRDSLSRDTSALSDTYYNKNTEDILRKSLTSLLDQWYLPSYGRVRVRHIRPEGTLLHISTAGVYIPFVFEGHIDAGLPKLQWPFVMAHEMSHGYGVTDEGECNFLAVLICANTDDPYIRYSGLLSYWRYLANSLLVMAPTLGEKAIAKRPHSITNDVKNIRATLDLYPDIFPILRDKIYDYYLKFHGINEGIASYGTVVRVIQMWKNSYHNRELYDKIYKIE